MSSTTRSIAAVYLLLVVSAVALIATLFVKPIAQDPAYYLFADTRGWLAVASFGDVLSNLPFLIIGIAGITTVWGLRLELQGSWPAYITFFIGVGLTGIGSSYFHLAPSNDTLLWDRLPMTIAFMPLFTIIIGDFVSAKAGRHLLPPLLIVGISSVFYWHWTESIGAGDLRPYGLVQFLPMLLIPLILILFKSADRSKSLYWGMIAFYVLAKLLEAADEQVFAITGVVSGHTLKHLAAAGAPLLLLLDIRRRFAKQPGTT